MEAGHADTTRTLRGILLMLASALAISLMFTLVRYLSAALHPFEIAFFRSLFGVVLLAPVLLGAGVRHLKTRRIGLLALRGALPGNRNESRNRSTKWLASDPRNQKGP